MLTQKKLKTIVNYNHETGLFIWNKRDGNKAFNSRFSGNVAGCKNSYGYIQITILGINYLAHRLAFLFQTGIMPTEVDHKNNVKHDNSFLNLRSATRAANNANRKAYKNNKSGFKGVYWSKAAGKWASQITINKKAVYLGLFDSAKDAAKEYDKIAVIEFGEFSLTNKVMGLL